MKKKILCLLLALLVLNLSFPHVAWAAELPISGECGAEDDGSNVTWVLDDFGLLTISGSGEMKDYNYSNIAPWYGHRDKIKFVKIEQGVTSIGNNAFSGCGILDMVTIPGSVTSIGDWAFSGCTSLDTVTIPAGVTSIGEVAFAFCKGLTSVTIPGSVKTIGKGAFSGCSGLETLFYENKLALTSANVPDGTAKIAYTVTGEQDGKTKVTLVKTSGTIAINCNEMGGNYIPSLLSQGRCCS